MSLLNRRTFLRNLLSSVAAAPFAGKAIADGIALTSISHPVDLSAEALLRTMVTINQPAYYMGGTGFYVVWCTPENILSWEAIPVEDVLLPGKWDISADALETVEVECNEPAQFSSGLTVLHCSHAIDCACERCALDGAVSARKRTSQL